MQCIHPAAGCIAGRENVSTALATGAHKLNKGVAAQSGTDLSCKICADLRSKQKMCAGMCACMLKAKLCFGISAAAERRCIS